MPRHLRGEKFVRSSIEVEGRTRPAALPRDFVEEITQGYNHVPPAARGADLTVNYRTGVSEFSEMLPADTPSSFGFDRGESIRPMQPIKLPGGAGLPLTRDLAQGKGNRAGLSQGEVVLLSTSGLGLPRGSIRIAAEKMNAPIPTDTARSFPLILAAAVVLLFFLR